MTASATVKGSEGRESNKKRRLLKKQAEAVTGEKAIVAMEEGMRSELRLVFFNEWIKLDLIFEWKAKIYSIT